MNYKIKSMKIFAGSLIFLVGCLVAIGYYAKANAAQANTNLLPEELSVITSIPEQIPVSFSGVTATKLGEQKPVLKYSMTNNADNDFTNTNFVVFVVDKEGNIKAGQGWTVKQSLAARQSSEVLVALKYDVAAEDHLVLTVYKAEGETKKFEVAPSKVLENFADQRLVKPIEKFVKTAGVFSPMPTPPPSACDAGQDFATNSCKCGIKSFSCNPTTGEFSFSCNSRAEGICPVAPPNT